MAVNSAKVTYLASDGTIQVIDVDANIFGFGTLAARPVGTAVGDMYLVADAPLFELQYWDGAWQSLTGATLVGPGPGITDKGIATWNGTGGATLQDAGVRHYGASATDPTTPAPADGDYYFNSVLEMGMFYDGSRSKWLSVETAELDFNRSGNTGSGAYYRSGNRSMSATLGRTAEWDGTVVSLTYTRQDVDSAAFQVVASGSTIVTLGSTSTSGSTTTADGTFSQGDVIAVRNAGPNASRHVIGTVRMKWMAP